MGKFSDAFNRKLKYQAERWFLSSGKYKVMPDICKEYIKEHDTVAVLAVGRLAEDIYHLRECTDGKIFLIDGDKRCPYEIIRHSFGEDTQAFLPEPKEYYGTTAGLREINTLLSEIGAQFFTEQFPPLPKEIPDNSLDAVFIMSLLATPDFGKHKGKPDSAKNFYKELVASIDKKLTPQGMLIVEESFGSDLLYDFEFFLVDNFGYIIRNEERAAGAMFPSHWLVSQKKG